MNDQVSALFTGTEPDKQVQLAADLAGDDYLITGKPLLKLQNDILGTENAANIISIAGTSKYKGPADGLFQFVKEQINQQLAAQGKTISDFANYKVGSYVYPSNNKNCGQFMIFLIPKSATLPKLGDVYYDPNNTSLAVPTDSIDNNLNNQIADLLPGTIKDSQVQFGANLASLVFGGDADRGRDIVLDDIVGDGNHDNYFESHESILALPMVLLNLKKSN
ncbi:MULTISPECIES: hypothetical protein [unclassified Lactobacillus]|uniref:hypothetical protein n=1 Tax=unclassified Lactobacillus TaxID=2620435 RepID=UPI000EFAEDC9|nr:MULTISPECIES: hypothetical protein [unclassified Lactobacillus]RMC24963.1 hypothetical protein F5ESL0247_02520 [Lactobacillus sp. ESL0247]RMC29118.1 hypothetical protein F5ESL0246_02520 [Lactobacillus sp. ESL0246]RMC32721.1 hypothetical protein F5ESL0245_02520 [Lactobacillus sp. ESL0245]